MINHLKSVQNDMLYSFSRKGPAEHTHFIVNLVRGFVPSVAVTWRSSPIFLLFTAHFRDFSGSSETAVKADSNFKIHCSHYLNYISF